MKGLLLKEFYSAGAYLKNFAIMLVIIIFFSVFTELGTTYVSMMMMMYLLVISISQYSIDEKSTWAPFSLCLPVKRVTIVGARYLFLLLLLVATMAFTFGLTAIVALVRGTEGWLPENLGILGVGTMLFLIVNSIIAPIVYKLGAEKARYAIMIVAMIPVLGAVLFSKQLTALLERFSGLNIPLLAAVAGVVAVAMYIGSMFLSARIYETREY
ncbi:ABC-2 transporter permease [Ruminococcaceae bacterium OttesenSCG-928-D13]|nr:ABC-2 transporter permease [Ruminococcaceae bacterium OttesenSCG-928-D13]